MNYRNSKHITNRRIGESELELLYGVFSRFCEGAKKGKVRITVKGESFGEFSSEDRSALDAMLLRRKPVAEIEFLYRNAEYDSCVCISVRDEFSSFWSSSLGTRLSIESTDEEWFDATWKKMEDVIDAFPITSCLSQILNKWHGVIAVVLAFALSFCTMRVIFRSLQLFSCVIPDRYAVLMLMAWVLIGVWYHSLISNFICNNYPVLDLDLYKTRSEIRRRCSHFFWWFLGAIGSLTIATYWPFGRQDCSNRAVESPAQSITSSATTVATNATNTIDGTNAIGHCCKKYE